MASKIIFNIYNSKCEGYKKDNVGKMGIFRVKSEPSTTPSFQRFLKTLFLSGIRVVLCSKENICGIYLAKPWTLMLLVRKFFCISENFKTIEFFHFV